MTGLFSSFDDELFASGSLAQPHHSLLKDGIPAVVKVFHFGTEDKFRGGLSLMRNLPRYVDPGVARFLLSTMVEKFAEMMTQAIDLLIELDSMLRFTAELEALEWLQVARSYPELSSQGVLTTEKMDGGTAYRR